MIIGNYSAQNLEPKEGMMGGPIPAHFELIQIHSTK